MNLDNTSDKFLFLCEQEHLLREQIEHLTNRCLPTKQLRNALDEVMAERMQFENFLEAPESQPSPSASQPSQPYTIYLERLTDDNDAQPQESTTMIKELSIANNVQRAYLKSTPVQEDKQLVDFGDIEFADAAECSLDDLRQIALCVARRYKEFAFVIEDTLGPEAPTREWLYEIKYFQSKYANHVDANQSFARSILIPFSIAKRVGVFVPGRSKRFLGDDEAAAQAADEERAAALLSQNCTGRAFRRILETLVHLCYMVDDVLGLTEFRQLAHKLAGELWRVLMLGDSRSGKSSALTTMLHRDTTWGALLPTDVINCTSVVTTVRQVAPNEPERAVAYGRSGDEPVTRPLLAGEAPCDTLRSLIQAQDRDVPFQYKHVDIFYDHPLLRGNVALSDGPGLNENQLATDVLHEAIAQAHVLMIAVNASTGLTDSMRKKLLHPSTKPLWRHKPVFIVVTHLDTIVADRPKYLRGMTDAQHAAVWEAATLAERNKTRAHILKQLRDVFPVSVNTADSTSGHGTWALEEKQNVFFVNPKATLEARQRAVETQQAAKLAPEWLEMEAAFTDDFLGKTYFANLSLLRSQSLTRVASELRTVSLVLTMARQTVEENLARIHELRAAVARSHESKQEGYRHIEQSCARIRQQLYEKTHGYWKERVVLAVGETVDGFHRDGSVAGYTWKGMEREIDEAVKTTIERGALEIVRSVIPRDVAQMWEETGNSITERCLQVLRDMPLALGDGLVDPAAEFRHMQTAIVGAAHAPGGIEKLLKTLLLVVLQSTLTTTAVAVLGMVGAGAVGIGLLACVVVYDNLRPVVVSEMLERKKAKLSQACAQAPAGLVQACRELSDSLCDEIAVHMKQLLDNSTDTVATMLETAQLEGQLEHTENELLELEQRREKLLDLQQQLSQLSFVPVLGNATCACAHCAEKTPAPQLAHCPHCTELVCKENCLAEHIVTYHANN